MTRNLTDDEKHLIARIAARLGGDEGAQLLRDLEQATVASAADDGSRITFEIAGHARPAYLGQHPYGVEGKLLDRDGEEMSVLLHADESGRLLELEFVRWGEGEQTRPDWDTLTLY